MMMILMMNIKKNNNNEKKMMNRGLQGDEHKLRVLKGKSRNT